jgi:hypothetical protein
MEKINSTSTVFKARITPAEVRAKIAEDQAKVAAKGEKIGNKVVEPKHPKREKPENLDAVVEETEEKKAKPKPKKKEPPALEFPVSARINNYGFIGVRKGLLAALDWHKGMALKIEKNPDGSVTVRKA